MVYCVWVCVVNGVWVMYGVWVCVVNGVWVMYGVWVVCGVCCEWCVGGMGVCCVYLLYDAVCVCAFVQDAGGW